MAVSAPFENLSVRDLRVGNRVRDVSFELRAGEVLGVLGPNGAGKSSLLQAIAGISPHQGSIELDGEEIATLEPRRRARRIGWLPQQSQSAWALNVRDVVALGRLPWGDENAEAIAGAVRACGIETLLERRIDQLSGGEQSRAWLARVLAGRPSVLLADEPIANLDLAYQRGAMQALRDYADASQADAGHGVLLAVHDLGLAARYCDRLLLLHEGKCVALGTPREVLTEARLSAVFDVPVQVRLDENPPLVALK